MEHEEEQQQGRQRGAMGDGAAVKYRTYAVEGGLVPSEVSWSELEPQCECITCMLQHAPARR